MRSRVTCPDCEVQWIAIVDDAWRFPVHYERGVRCEMSAQLAPDKAVVPDE